MRGYHLGSLPTKHASRLKRTHVETEETDMSQGKLIDYRLTHSRFHAKPDQSKCKQLTHTMDMICGGAQGLISKRIS